MPHVGVDGKVPLLEHRFYSRDDVFEIDLFAARYLWLGQMIKATAGVRVVGEKCGRAYGRVDRQLDLEFR